MDVKIPLSKLEVLKIFSEYLKQNVVDCRPINIKRPIDSPYDEYVLEFNGLFLTIGGKE